MLVQELSVVATEPLKGLGRMLKKNGGEDVSWILVSLAALCMTHRSPDVFP